jgi:hypothetical protein
MKIIDIGICIDNVDPKGLGRIRCVRYSDYVGSKEKALKKYEPWSKNDLFVALPFLPTNINFIPEIEQLVKIINYNTRKINVNQEYIAGPFTTMFLIVKHFLNKLIIQHMVMQIKKEIM